MKILTLLTAMFLVIGVGFAQAEESAKKYTPEQIAEMPRFSSIEQQRCPKSRYPSVKKRLECKYEVRIELYEKQQAEAQESKG